MRHRSNTHLRPLRLSIAISATCWPLSPAFAGDVAPGQSVVVDGRDAGGEKWTVASTGHLEVIGGSRIGFVDVSNGTLLMRTSEGTGRGSIIPYGVRLANGAMGTFDAARVSGDLAGLTLSAHAGAPGDNARASAIVRNRSEIRGSSAGATLYANSILEVSDSDVTGTDAGSVGLAIHGGTATLRENSSVTGDAHGVSVAAAITAGLVTGDLKLVVDGSSVEGRTDSAIQVTTLDPSWATRTSIELRNGATLRSGNGVAIGLDAGASAAVLVSGSDIAGDIVASAGARGTLDLKDEGTLTGAVRGDIAVGVSDALWRVTGDSTVSTLTLERGTIRFDRADAPGRLVVRGDLTGTGGAVALNVALAAGGASSGRTTDRLLIEGDVTTTGTTKLVVTGRGAGAPTDTNGNGLPDAGEGISLVQVGGRSTADRFVLRGGYVAMGPWQYTLHAFGPGVADASQSELPGGVLGWDYRLASRDVCEDGCEPVEPPVDPPVGPVEPPVDPVEPPVTPGPGPGPGSRPAVVPQLASYLSAPTALLTYGDAMADGLHERLGDLRDGAPDRPLGGDVFARLVGSQLRYTSNLSFRRYGYDFAQRLDALQLGGSIVAVDGDAGSLRAGWAAERGRTRVTPKAPDGDSSAEFRASGVSAWTTWRHESGFWVDGVVGARRYSGDIGTAWRGADVARLRANAWSMSIEAGMPVAVGGDWSFEPRMQAHHQSLAFHTFTDADGLDVTPGRSKQTRVRLGARVARMPGGRFAPYASVDVMRTGGGARSTRVSGSPSGTTDAFGSGRSGDLWRVAAGAVSQLTDHVQVYGQGTYQHFVGSYGMRGWSGNLGVRVTF
ncbi:autotransporter outer membrane beta-barrel domain-containing protein [Luteibacter sp. 329MFSha]|uniref:autotransporter family protein n=1 Tax=Luteibacter sp. 329MFSha TaxID=1798239 RepID=UPI0008CE8703|nr:autotransporter outer membrane beta-barrel domain-containing protein [Luteibacter sp. 329MFSha]SEV93883.1 outer membrane autotransporter barrel domain-containing protein [Luteibacter sp. 329MFSha]